jgi:predicted HicB family RNase H-like nuclease
MVQLTVRLPDDLHTKIKVISVYENTTINTMITEALQVRADQWEQKHGRLPEPA